MLGWLVHFGLKCSSWTAVNSGTSGRTICTPIGNTLYESVVNGNCLAKQDPCSNLICLESFVIPWDWILVCQC